MTIKTHPQLSPSSDLIENMQICILLADICPDVPEQGGMKRVVAHQILQLNSTLKHILNIHKSCKKLLPESLIFFHSVRDPTNDADYSDYLTDKKPKPKTEGSWASFKHKLIDLLKYMWKSKLQMTGVDKIY
ncbi:hypothetical protein PHYBLDRAFT_59444 [Phycomyces blakesleeanus NRRL 1555(-)]|uniref:Uncharacterized protein n=1 Tax=Phycomyces blakesleeanus (strain ATCC 8743b / DSM 1359 / FGSC 10004 / NBRC 33097 / NRRL 1555) TaxID=763407 RepID=A0A167NHK3_PHYB8|nr:hypothetical protein PHYBLDRAFT_59444 [Phycomyces blakesleeanus NRRL 1555(-)]OAD75914.1 hypothetical protein PHYBLDRAFT_59444 [Phycomyces blakesleeanus NRRL 1555(-)]|eukprot:XP_018293954.1 hypothetical protein PHYBLDRAFT_59444 [Phycomyces blakesleeanus NRRL 1555(-)]